jgi:hypothetical protein
MTGAGIMRKLINFFDGKKTGISAVLLAGLIFLRAADFITQKQFEFCFDLAGAGGLGAVGFRLAKIRKEINQAKTPGDPI